MDATTSRAATTRICAAIIGPLMLILGLYVCTRFDDVARMIPALLHDEPLVFITGFFTLIAGVVLFALHHHWNNITAIIVSALALLTIFRGVVLMFQPSFLMDVSDQVLRAGPGVVIAGGVALLIGAWLSYAGWFARSV